MGAKRTSNVGIMADRMADGVDMPISALETNGKALLTVPEAAAHLNISARTCWKRVWSGELETVWIGKRRFVPALAITVYVRQLCMQSGARETYRLMAS